MLEFGDPVEDLLSLAHAGLDLAAGVHHGGVVAVAECLAYVGKGQLGHVARDVHGDLASINERPAPTSTSDLFDLEVEHLSGEGDDALGGDGGLRHLGDEIAENEGGKVDVIERNIV